MIPREGVTEPTQAAGTVLLGVSGEGLAGVGNTRLGRSSCAALFVLEPGNRREC